MPSVLEQKLDGWMIYFCLLADPWEIQDIKSNLASRLRLQSTSCLHFSYKVDFIETFK